MHVRLWLFVNINAVIFGFKIFFVVSVKMFVNPASRLTYKKRSMS